VIYNKSNRYIIIFYKHVPSNSEKFVECPIVLVWEVGAAFRFISDRKVSKGVYSPEHIPSKNNLREHLLRV
jgi:hypothetical protein